MEVLEIRDGEADVLLPQGRLDTVTSKPFEQLLLQHIGGGAKQIVVDLSELDYISSAGLRVLLTGAKKQKAANARLALCSLKAHIREVFEMGGFTEILEIHENRKEALAALR